MNLAIVKYYLLISASWYCINGLLHDVFVLLRHKSGYDRDLLRLLMDGHLLILSGILMFVASQAMEAYPYFASVIGAVVASGMIIYCIMIFPFLKSFGTLAVSVVLLAFMLRVIIASSSF